MPRICTVVATLALALVASAPAFAGDEPAKYGINVGASPFGGSLNLGYHYSEKNTLNISMGGLPGMEMDLEIDGKDYTVEASSAWMGAFFNHRPCNNDWFRLVVGLGIGSISNEITDNNGNAYEANYNENPVGYLGMGFGQRPVKGFLYGLDLGILQTAGPAVAQTKGDANANAVDAISENMMFGPILPNAQVTLGWGF
jgi:hypothetical protein